MLIEASMTEVLGVTLCGCTSSRGRVLGDTNVLLDDVESLQSLLIYRKAEPWHALI